MAQITWRNIDAPQLSTRDLSLAGGQITNAFDRLGQQLFQREATLRDQATDSAIAQRLAIQDPQAMGALNLQGLDRRVNLRALAEADNAHRSDLIQRADQNEDLLNKRALAQFGQQYGALAEAAYNGDAAAQAEIQERSARDPLWGRFMAQTTDNLMGFRDSGVGRRETERSNRAGEGLQGQANAISARRAALAERQYEDQLQRRAEDEQQERYARRFVAAWTQESDPLASAQDSRRLLTETKTFKNMAPALQDRVLAALDHEILGREARLTPTEAQLQELNDPLSRIGSLTADLEASRSSAQSFYDAQHRPSQAIARAQELGEVAPEELDAYAKTRGIDRDAISRFKAANPHVTDAHIMAALQTDGSIRDADFWSRRNFFGGAGNWNWEFFHGGENALRRRVEEMNERLGGAGDTAAYENGRAAITASEDRLLADLGRLNTQLLRAKAAGRDTSTIEAQIKAAEDKVKRLRAGE